MNPEKFFEDAASKGSGHRPPRWVAERWGEPIQDAFASFVTVHRRHLEEGKPQPSINSLIRYLDTECGLKCSKYIAKRYLKEVMGYEC